MPQMYPLPWVSLLVMVLGLMAVYMVLVYFSISKSVGMKNISVGQVKYAWKW